MPCRVFFVCCIETQKRKTAPVTADCSLRNRCGCFLAILVQNQFRHFIDIACSHGKHQVVFLGVVGYKVGDFIEIRNEINFFSRVGSFHFRNQLFGTDFIDVLFSSCVNVCQNDFVRILKSLSEFVEEGQCSRISVGLKDAPQCFMGNVGGRCQSGFDFRRMVGVIVYQTDPSF